MANQLALQDQVQEQPIFIQGGKLERHYPDGKTVPVTLKTGDTLYLDKPEDEAPYAIKNVGKTAVKIYLVTIK